MALKFSGKTIKCGDVHSDLIDVRRDVHVDEQWFWGGLGLSELRGGLGGSDMICTAYIYDREKWNTVAKYDKLWQYIDELRGDKWLLKHGEVKCTGTIGGTKITRKVPDCTLRSVELLPFDNQETPRPLNAIAQSQWGSWVIPVRFTWRVLS